MLTLLDTIKIIGAFAAVVGTTFNIRNSKQGLLWRIDRKSEQLRKVDHDLVVKYGLHRGTLHPITALDKRKSRLERQINDLKRLL